MPPIGYCLKAQLTVLSKRIVMMWTVELFRISKWLVWDQQIGKFFFFLKYVIHVGLINNKAVNYISTTTMEQLQMRAKSW